MAAPLLSQKGCQAPKSSNRRCTRFRHAAYCTAPGHPVAIIGQVRAWPIYATPEFSAPTSAVAALLAFPARPSYADCFCLAVSRVEQKPIRLNKRKMLDQHFYMALLPLLTFSFVGALMTDPARTPPLGWNSWNTFEESVSDAVLRAQALAMHLSGLQAAGYQFVSSDDSWMLGTRDAEGHLIPNPAKFPDGIEATIAYIHSLNLSVGLYTARGTKTCCGFAGACGYEATDAAWYAGLEIDLLKDDACSSCGNATFYDSYGKMQRGLEATGRPIVLCIEGDPDPAVLTKGGYGQTHRVGHDLSAHYRSMLSSADIGSGLWPYAHNSTSVPGNPTGYCECADVCIIADANARSLLSGRTSCHSCIHQHPTDTSATTCLQHFQPP
jgi:hypothetical protein